MDHAKKMMVVSPEFIQRLTATADVTGDVYEKVLSQLDNDMQNVLNSKLNDREKWTEYYQVLQRYLQFANQIRKPADVEASVSSEIPLSDMEIFDTIPKIYKRNAHCLVNILKKSKLIEWDNKGTVNIKGERIPSSNIIDLINDVVRSRKTTNPVGIKQFGVLINDLNVPKEFISSGCKRTFCSANQEISTELLTVRDDDKEEEKNRDRTIQIRKKKKLNAKLPSVTYKTRSSRSPFTGWEKFKL